MTQLGPGRQHEPGEGPLGRISNNVYWTMICALLFILVTLPGLVPMLFLDRSIGNLPLVALCLIPVGPAWSALLFGLRDREKSESVTPGRSFWRGYRMNAVDVLKLWVPALVVLTILAVNLAYLDYTGVPPGYGIVLLVLVVLVVVWVIQAVYIATFFTLRTRDVARLGVYYLGRLPMVALGILALVITATGVVFVTFDAVLVMLAWAFAWLLLITCQPLAVHVRKNFVA